MHTTRERVVRWQDPAASAELIRTSTGLDALRAVRDGGLPPPPIAMLMNFRLLTIDAGHVVVEGQPGEEHYNPIGSVHGGFALTLFNGDELRDSLAVAARGRVHDHRHQRAIHPRHDGRDRAGPL